MTKLHLAGCTYICPSYTLAWSLGLSNPALLPHASIVSCYLLHQPTNKLLTKSWISATKQKYIVTYISTLNFFINYFKYSWYKNESSYILFLHANIQNLQYILHLQNISIWTTFMAKAQEQHVATGYCVAKYISRV